MYGILSLSFTRAIPYKNFYTQPMLMRTMLRKEVALMPRYTYRR
ncbi:hypothetical protein Hdeb2414_s0027g00692811 [Helianthus debilis subsp. tardiflorus]